MHSARGVLQRRTAEDRRCKAERAGLFSYLQACGFRAADDGDGESGADAAALRSVRRKRPRDRAKDEAIAMGMPQARVTDMHVCPMVTGIVPHVGGPILPPCMVTTLVGCLPAAR